MAPLNFVIDNFETSITLDVCGIMVGQSYLIDASAHALLNVMTSKLKQSFAIQSDSSDVLNAADSDLKFYLGVDSFWDAGFGINPADADVAASGGSLGPIASGFTSDKNMVCHDFVRFIADKLFNTHHGVDLLDNERELLDDIRKQARDVWTTMASEVNKYGDGTSVGSGTHLDMKTDASGLKYSQNDLSESIVRKVYVQMINSASGRERFKTGVVSGSKFSLPFEDNDTIEIKITINPESNQHTLTNVPSLGARSYKIIYKLVADSSYVEPVRDINEIADYKKR
jgi:hypothetical protein